MKRIKATQNVQFIFGIGDKAEIHIRKGQIWNIIGIHNYGYFKDHVIQRSDVAMTLPKNSIDDNFKVIESE